MTEVELSIFNSGRVPTRKGVVVSGGGRARIMMPALFAMIRHPEHGVILYDTGYSTRFYQATRNLPYRIMRFITPARIREEDNAVNQLERAGVAAAEVRTIILGHGHVDHVPGVSDFPRAEVIIDRREWEAMQGPPLRLFAKAYLKSLYQDMVNPLRLLDFDVSGAPLAGFDRAIDLFNDGSLILTPLPGHTPGQMGLLVNARSGRFFLIGDAAWVSENYLDLTPPAFPIRIILSSFSDFMVSLKKVREFHERDPEAIIVPSHCPTTWAGLAKESDNKP